MFALWRFRKDHAHAATLKALELAMAGASGKRVGARLRLMKELLPDLKDVSIPTDERLREAKLGSSIQRKQDLIALLAAHPDQRANILTDWHSAFPSDTWLVLENGKLCIREKKN